MPREHLEDLAKITPLQMDLISEHILPPHMAEPPANVPELFHYTAADGLKGIVSEAAMWLTNAAYVNDAHELTYSVSVAKSVVRALLERESDDRRRALLGAIDRSLESHALYKAWYIGSFTTDGNALSQWRAYCSAGGYSLGLDGKKFFDGLPSQTSYLLGAVVYDQSQQAKRVEAVVERYYRVWEKFREKYVEVSNDDYDSEVAEQLSFWLSRELIFFKSPAFSTESEWRLAKRPLTTEEVSFRNRAGILTPYLVIPLVVEAKLPMTQLVVSPLGEIELASHAAQTLLHNKEYDEVRIYTPRYRLRF